MMAVDWAGYGYAALVTSGGVIGYVKAGNEKAQEVIMFIELTLETKRGWVSQKHRWPIMFASSKH